VKSKVHRTPHSAIFSTPRYTTFLGPNINLNIHFSNFLNLNISDQFYSRTNQQKTSQFSVSWILFFGKQTVKQIFSTQW